MPIMDEEIEEKLKILEETVKWLLENCPIEEIKVTANPNKLFIRVKSDKK